MGGLPENGGGVDVGGFVVCVVGLFGRFIVLCLVTDVGYEAVSMAGM